MTLKKISPSLDPFRTPLRVESGSRTASSLFHLGEILEGRVIEKIDGSHVMIQLKGHELLVESRIPLPENFEGSFRVDATHPQIILKVLGEEGVESAGSWRDLWVGAFAEKVSGLLEKEEGCLPVEIRDSIQQVAALFKGISPDASWIERVLFQSGLFFEAKLRRLVDLHQEDRWDQIAGEDLKGLLLKLKSHMEAFMAQGGISTEILSDSEDRLRKLDQILGKVEAYQALNLHLPEGADKHFILLPVWYQERLHFAEIALLFSRSSDQPEPEALSLLFLLDLPALGEMSIEVKIVNRELYCRFNVAEPESCLFMREVLSELRSRLTQIGFQPQLSVESEPPEKILSLSSLMESGEGMRSLLNVVV
jgi:hypothetical protein